MTLTAEGRNVFLPLSKTFQITWSAKSWALGALAPKLFAAYTFHRLNFPFAPFTTHNFCYLKAKILYNYFTGEILVGEKLGAGGASAHTFHRPHFS